MKLHEAKLATQKPLPFLQEMFDRIKRFKPDVKLDDIARFCADLEIEMGNMADRQSISYVLYNGISPLKGNPKAMNEVIQSFVDHYDDMDEDEESWEDLVETARRFFRTK